MSDFRSSFDDEDAAELAEFAEAQNAQDLVTVDTAPFEDDRSFDDLYSPDTLWKARNLIVDERVHKTTDKIWTVEGSQPYIVTIIEGNMEVPWATCTCPNGEARGGRPSCYHTAAVLATVLGISLDGISKPVKGGRR